MAGSEIFFDRLNRWFVEAGILKTEAFYVQWLDFILTGLGIPAGRFSSRAEPKFIYRLFDYVDPLYYRPDRCRSPHGRPSGGTL